MCYKLVHYYSFRISSNNPITLTLSQNFKDELYEAALEYSKQFKDETFTLFIQIKNEPCWKSKEDCYKYYLKNASNDEYEFDYEENWKIKNGEFLEDF